MDDVKEAGDHVETVPERNGCLDPELGRAVKRETRQQRFPTLSDGDSLPEPFDLARAFRTDAGVNVRPRSYVRRVFPAALALGAIGVFDGDAYAIAARLQSHLRNDEQISEFALVAFEQRRNRTVGRQQHLCFEARADLLFLAGLFQGIEHFFANFHQLQPFLLTRAGGIRDTGGNFAGFREQRDMDAAGSSFGLRMYDQTSSVVNASSGARRRTNA